MTTLGPLDLAGWATTGVDLDTRRIRVLWGLAALGRTGEQRQFQARCQAFMEIDEALLTATSKPGTSTSSSRSPRRTGRAIGRTVPSA